jgi:hypothetical protein
LMGSTFNGISVYQQTDVGKIKQNHAVLSVSAGFNFSAFRAG